MASQAPAPTTGNEEQKALIPARAAAVFDADDPVSLYMDLGVFEQLQRVARMMSEANLVPAHLRSTPAVGSKPAEDKTADCFLVAAQAFRWRMDPFSVAQESFVTSGKLGFSGKLIAGLINASGRLQENLEPIYSGEKGTPQRTVRIVGRLRGSSKDREVEGTVGQWQTANEKWKSMPDQMLFYRGAREWARRHMPEVMLGIQVDEEIGEAVTLERSSTGTFVAHAPRTLDQVAEQLESGTAATPETPPTTTPAPPSREPGEDDDTPTPRAAVEAFVGRTAPPAAASAAKPPRQGRLQE